MAGESKTYDNLSISNGRGQLYQSSNGQVTRTVNGYDTAGNILSETKVITGDPNGYTTAYTYDLAGRQATITYPDGFSVTNAYFPGTHLLASVTGSDSNIYAQVSAYTPQGKIGRIDYPNNTYTEYSYDDWSERLMEIRTVHSGTLATLLDKNYAYTCAGDIAGITDTVRGVAYTYAYDNLHRLTGETNNGGQPAKSYTYNPIGNILSKWSALKIVTLISYIHNEIM